VKITRRILDNILILDLTGEVRLGESAKMVSETLEDLLRDNAVAGVVINMEDINYIDSTGLGELVGYLTRFEGQGKKLHLINPNQTVRRLLQLTQLDTVFTIHATEEEAITSITS